MRTQFSPLQLADPHLAEAEKNVRACMHCGICTATCPTYVLLGDERDGPRGRIVMMQQMLEEGGAPEPETVLHIDRCLSCLACRTACPSNVDYARLVDTARAYVEEHHRRPFGERMLRWFIAHVMARPNHIRFGLMLSRSFAPLARVIPGRLGRIARLGASMPLSRQAKFETRAPAPSQRVAILPGCVQQVVAPDIDAAIARVLARRGVALVPLARAGCCGALAHHLGRAQQAKAYAKRVIEAFEKTQADGIESVTIGATGCAAHLKDYPHLFRGDPHWEKRAENFASRFRDVSELITPRQSWPPRKLRVAFHSACSAENGLKLKGEPQDLLRDAGFEVLAIPEGHLCCGSAGSYSLLQPEISDALRARKLGNIAAVRPDIVATGNIGCLIQLAGPDAPPVVHYAELIDWVEGGATPQVLLQQKIEGTRAKD
jgi:glycolate oxidase iron-sulfur subunit